MPPIFVRLEIANQDKEGEVMHEVGFEVEDEDEAKDLFESIKSLLSDLSLLP